MLKPPCKSDLVIDNQQFAVVAPNEISKPLPTENLPAVVHVDRSPKRLQPFEKITRQIEAAKGVGDNGDLDTLAAFFFQSLPKQPADMVVLPDVHHDLYFAAG
jgi:hypothetical protein